MANLNGFDANEVPPQQPLEVLPAGRYTVAIVESELKATKNGNGEYLKLTLEVVDGQYKGRKLFENLNLKNQNEQTVQIARSTLSAICHAVGVLKPRDSVELHNIAFVATVGHEKRKDTDELQNRVKGYEKRGAAQSATPAAKPAAGSKPWQR